MRRSHSHRSLLNRAILAATVAVGSFVSACADEPTDDLLGELVVQRVESLGVLPRSPWIEGRDGGSSGLAFGLTVWVYGDTVLTMPDENDGNWHTNSFELADPATWRTDGFAFATDSVGAPAFFVALTDEEREWNRVHGAEECSQAPCGTSWALWPSAPLFDAERGRAWVLYGLYNDAHPSGIGVASWDGPDEPVVRHRVGDSWLLFTNPQPELANAPTIFDGHLYAFGCQRDFLAHECMLGRAPLTSPDDPNAWQFFDGARWSPRIEDAVVLFEGAPIMEVSFNRFLDRWIIVYSPPFENSAMMRIARRLEGPWSDPVVLFEAPGDAPYDLVHHPELEEGDGRVQFITYSQPRGDGSWFGSEHHMWRITLALQP